MIDLDRSPDPLGVALVIAGDDLESQSRLLDRAGDRGHKIEGVVHIDSAEIRYQPVGRSDANDPTPRGRDETTAPGIQSKRNVHLSRGYRRSTPTR